MSLRRYRSPDHSEPIFLKKEKTFFEPFFSGALEDVLRGLARGVLDSVGEVRSLEGSELSCGEDSLLRIMGKQKKGDDDDAKKKKKNEVTSPSSFV